MATPNRWIANLHDPVLRRHHAAGHSLRRTAGEMGFGLQTISDHAKEIGLSWDQASKTQAAANARNATAKDRRARIQLGLLEDAEKLRSQIFAPTLVYNFGGKDNDYNERMMDEPPHADKLRIMQAVGIAVDKSLKLAEHDSTGAEEGRSLMRGIAEAFGLGAAEEEKDPDEST